MSALQAERCRFESVTLGHHHHRCVAKLVKGTGFLIPAIPGSNPGALASHLYFSRCSTAVVQRFHTALVACSNQAAGTKILLTSFNGRTLGCGPGDAVFDSPQ